MDSLRLKMPLHHFDKPLFSEEVHSDFKEIISVVEFWMNECPCHGEIHMDLLHLLEGSFFQNFIYPWSGHLQHEDIGGKISLILKLAHKILPPS